MSQIDKLNFLGEVEFNEVVKFTNDVEVAGSLKKGGNEILTGADLSAPDWNQYDEIAPDYIKNRTHWTISKFSRVMADANLDTLDAFVIEECVGDSFVVEFYDGSTADGILKKSEDGILNAGGPEYYIGNLYWARNYIGNGEVLGDDSSPYNTGEDFCVWIDKENFPRVTAIFRGNTDKFSYVDSYNIYHNTITIKQLDEKYIPDNIKRFGIGDNSFVANPDCEATGTKSFAEGSEAKASGIFSHAEGYKTQAKGGNTHVEGNSTIAEGLSAHAEGSLSQALEANAHAEGASTSAKGRASHSEGSETTAQGDYSHAEGSETQAIGDKSHAEGYLTQAIGLNTHSEGSNTIAEGESAHAEGQNTLAKNLCSHAEGGHTQAGGEHSHAEGYYSAAEGNRSHAEGNGAKAKGTNAHAEGLSTIASGDSSHAEGDKSEAKGNVSHAEGSSTKAEGPYSHTEGVSTTASGSRSHAEGTFTIATGRNQHVQGRYNIADEVIDANGNGNYAHIVGNGTKDTPSNAHTLDWKGNAWFAGNITIGEDKKLATEDFVRSLIEDVLNTEV